MSSGVLILGGYGNFGARIARLLAEDPAPRLVIAGRDKVKADALAKALRHDFPNLIVEGVSIDLADAKLSRCIVDSGCAVTIHTAGPFQGQDYAVAQACIEAKVHYVDLADGRAFVTGFGCLDEQAKKAGVLAVTGASSFPGLSMAVIDHLASYLELMESVDIALAIAGAYPPGRATTQAILGYCGQQIPVWRQGKWKASFGWLDLTWRRMPGLGWRLLGLCDVPDLELLPQAYPKIKDGIFRVALESRLAQLGFAIMALLRKSGWVDDWRPLTPLIDRLAGLTRFLGSDASAMTIRVSGQSQTGKTIAKTYVLNARSGHGPMIPCLPSVVLVRKLARGEISQRGAFICRGLFTLKEVEAAFKESDISSRIA